MTSGKPSSRAGFTLVELVMVIAVVGVLVVLGSLVIAKLAPAYFTSVNAQQAVAAPEMVLWQMRRDFEKMLVSGTTYNPVSCDLVIRTTYGTSSGDIAYTFASNQIKRNNALLLNHVTPTPPATCPYTLYMQPGGTTPSQLGVNFSYASGIGDTVDATVLTSLYSYVAAPDLTSISQTCDLTTPTLTSISGTGTSLTSITGVTFGGTLANAWSTLSDILAAVTAPSHSAGLVSVAVTTQEGTSMLQNAFRYISLTPSNGTTLTSVIIDGAGFTGATGVTFGGNAGTVILVSDTQITVDPPATCVGPVSVEIQGITPPCTVTNAFTCN